LKTPKEFILNKHQRKVTNMKQLNFYIYLLVILVSVGCGSNQVVLPETTTEYSLNNTTIQEIFDLQDRRKPKELLVFFDHPDATYRYITAMAFASIQDTTQEIINALAEATNDADEEVRYAAIYALGQSGHERAVEPLVKAFKNDLSTASNRWNAMVLESVGKCGTEQDLAYLVKPQKYAAQDTFLFEGQSAGIYRFALRGLTSKKGTKQMVKFVSDPSYSVNTRRMSAQYLGRAKDIDLTEHKSKILKAIQSEKDDYTKMALVNSVRKMVDEDSSALKVLKKQFSRSADYRIKINIMRVLASYDYPAVRSIFMSALKSKNEQVRIHAARYFRTNAFRPDVELYYEIGSDSTSTDWRLKLNMLGAALSNISYTKAALRKKINETVRSIYLESKNPYEKGLALEASSGFAGNYKFLMEETLNKENDSFVRTKALEGLVTIRNNPRLAAIFGEYYLGVASQIKKIFKNAIIDGDIGLISVAASAIRNPDFRYKASFKYDNEFLKTAQDKLKLPKEMEAFYDLQKTIDYLTDAVAPKVELPEFNHPINWGTLKDVNPNTFARIETDKGEVILEFYHTLSPASVGNFIKLARDGFFDGKSFHRVVGNFVAQAGCPRGDGYGSLDYSLRSELSTLKYDDEGYVGMASAGKDTEGVQFFITHSPTPHLDGKYTIFAKVTEGMEVVHQLMVGDKIKSVTIKNDIPMDVK
jgi:cyclophilin family peptidyl-prolyl cis-trans isomerase/HEAT repeat protein